MSTATRFCLPALALFLSLTNAANCYAQPPGPGPISFNFSGTVQPFNALLINPYSGEIVRYTKAQANVNNTSYTGDADLDTISFTNLPDVLTIRNDLDQQVVDNMEIFFASQGPDLINLADPVFTLNDIRLFGSTGDDILWGNVGNDIILGEVGDDHIVGGPGNDDLRGGDQDDYLSGGSSQSLFDLYMFVSVGTGRQSGFPLIERLDGGLGDDTLFGGSGSDGYVTGLGIDRILETPGPELNVIYAQSGLTADDFDYEIVGDDLVIGFAGTGRTTIEDQFASPGAGIDAIILENGTGDVIDLRAMFVPEPSAIGLAVMGGLLATTPRRRKGSRRSCRRNAWH